MDLWASQDSICRKHDAACHPTDPERIVAVARDLISGLQPLNGLRQPAGYGATGWYLWAGDGLLPPPAFFEPMLATHLALRCPELIPYLGLGPGWRFRLAGKQVAVWQDPQLLQIQPDWETV